MEYTLSTLDNGLRVLSITLPHTRAVSVGFYLNVGSRYETSTTAGAFHFIEHMLFKGTRQRPTAEAIAETIEARGGLLNASTGTELTTFWVKVMQAHLPIALELLTDMLRHSLFDPGEMEKERRVILEELRMSRDAPEELVDLLLDELSWPDHPLAWDVAGTYETVQAIHRDVLLEYLTRFYTPRRTVISVAGNVAHQSIVEQVNRLLGDWRGEEPGAFSPAPDGQTAPRLTVRWKEIEQAHVSIRLPGLPRLHPDRYTLTLLNAILGGGMTSRLFLTLRERLGLAYLVESYVIALADTGKVDIYISLEPKQTTRALSVIWEQLARLRQEPVSQEELDRAREAIKGRLILGMEDSLAVSGWYGRQLALQNHIWTVDETLDALDNVTPEDLQQLAQKLFRADRLCLAVVGPFNEQHNFDASVQEALQMLPPTDLEPTQSALCGRTHR